MNRITIHLEALRHNIGQVHRWMEGHGASWTLVTKVLCGHTDTLKALQTIGVRCMGDTRLSNLRAIERTVPDLEAWYLRPPSLSDIGEIVRLTDASLNSERKIIEALDAEAGRQGKTHSIVVMIELGDLREGILPSSLVEFYDAILHLPNIRMLGVGANIGCLSGTVPNVDLLTQLVLYRELLELKFERQLPMISAGSSLLLPLLLKGQIPKAINHFRIGEAVFLGSNLVNGGTLEGLRADAIQLEAEVVEIKEKSLVPVGETSSVTPFEAITPEDTAPGQRGYRAIVAVGQLDTDVTGLTPINPRFKIAGASSDLTVVNVGDDTSGLRIGDSISFHVNYAALVRLMSGPYIDRVVIPGVEEFTSGFSGESRVDVPPILDSIEPVPSVKRDG
ncbi:alanine racemase [bacterium]|nr:alanine racemase [bacterium]MBU1983099.1 alanine racemase [bacterium]